MKYLQWIKAEFNNLYKANVTEFILYRCTKLLCAFTFKTQYI